VPHDQPLKTKKEMIVAQKEPVDDAPSESTADLTAMFDDVNDLPADDPLRTPANTVAAVAERAERPVAGTVPKATGKAEGVPNLLPAKVVTAFQPGAANSAMPTAEDATGHVPALKAVPAARVPGSVVVNAGLRVPVPSFEGAGLRSVVERADSVGLRVQVVGSGLAREQVPAAGTMVPAGTEVVVQFTR
jgi:cell division protein FtsI (penicillin-binding protein 3)